MSWASLAVVVLGSAAAGSAVARAHVSPGLLPAIQDPAQRDAALCALVRAKKTDDEPCHVNSIVEAPQRDGAPIVVTFFDHEWSREFAGQGRPRGHFELVAANGTLLPIWLNANVLDASDDLVHFAGDDRLATVQVIPFEHGARLLVVVPVETIPGPLLSVFIGPSREEENGPDHWTWRLVRQPTGAPRVEIGPGGELDRNQPRASFRWNPKSGQYEGPSGSPDRFFLRVQPKDVSARARQYAEAADRVLLQRRLREATPDSVVQFSIQNESGQPQTGEACLYRPEEVKSRCHAIWHDGLTWFDNVPAGVWTMDVRGTQRDRLQEFLVAAPSRPRTLHIRRNRARIVVTDDAGKGLPRVALKLSPNGASISWTTNAAGEVAGPLPAGEYAVTAFLMKGDATPRATGILRVRPGSEGFLRLKISRGERVAGRVVDSEGRPVSGAYVSGVPGERTEDGQGWGNTRSTPDGTFLLDGLRPGRVAIEARSEDRTSLSRLVSLEIPRTGGELTLVMVRRPQVRGQVIDRSGRPITHFILGDSLNERTVSDPSGRFELALFDEDPELLRFEASGYAVTWLTSQAQLGTSRDLGRIVIPPAAGLEGTVVDAASRKPLEGVHVSQQVVVPERRTGLCGTGYRAPPEGTSWAESHAGGRFRLTSLAADARLELSKEGYETKVVPAADLWRVVTLEPSVPRVLRVEGRVLDEAGKPSFGCISFRGPLYFQGRVFAGTDGFFSIDLPSPGPVTLAACAELDGPEFAETVVQVSAGTQRVSLQTRR